ncbi:hypothetical protein DET48_1141, partial [Vibrio diazotrophicus]
MILDYMIPAINTVKINIIENTHFIAAQLNESALDYGINTASLDVYQRAVTKFSYILCNFFDSYDEHDKFIVNDGVINQLDLFSKFFLNNLILEDDVYTCFTYMKLYRQIYTDLISKAFISSENKKCILSLSNYIFEIIEEKICRSFNHFHREDKTINVESDYKMADRQRNQLIAVLESISFPVFNINQEGHVHRANTHGYILLPENVQDGIKCKKWNTLLDNAKFNIENLIDGYQELYDSYFDHGNNYHRVKIFDTDYECYPNSTAKCDTRQYQALRNPLMILRKIINLSWIHILSCDQMISPKNN